MKAITVRDATGKLICFGADDGNYAPDMSGKPVGAVKSSDEDYDTVLAEWQALVVPSILQEVELNKKQHVMQALETLLADPVAVTLLKDKLGVK